MNIKFVGTKEDIVGLKNDFCRVVLPGRKLKKNTIIKVTLRGVTYGPYKVSEYLGKGEYKVIKMLTLWTNPTRKITDTILEYYPSFRMQSLKGDYLIYIVSENSLGYIFKDTLICTKMKRCRVCQYRLCCSFLEEEYST